MNAKPRIEYIDNLRIFLTASVIINHVLITYGGPGGWYYREFEIAQLDLASLVIIVLLTAVNQAYIMGFFFFISGYFSSKSLSTKETPQFLIQRFLRLGVPVLLFVYLISPLLKVVYKRIMYGLSIDLSSFRTVYQQLEFGYELGPMWFALLLLILSLLFLPWSLNSKWSKKIQKYPSALKILLYAFSTGLFTFLIRLKFPIGYVFQPLNLQIPQLIQYISAYFMGIVAFHGGWFDHLDQLFARSWLYLIIGLFLSMPFVFVLSGGLEGDVTRALGGFHWQSLVYSVWEQLICVSFIVTGIYYFKKYANSTSRLTQEMVSSSYAAYLIHPLVLVTFTTMIHKVTIYPLLKISLTIFPAIILSFIAAAGFRRIPGLKQIL